MEVFKTILTGLVFLMLGLGFSYFLATQGEPQSVWVWNLLIGGFE